MNDAATKESFDNAAFDRPKFVSTGEAPYRIPKPNLAFEERSALEEFKPGPVPSDELSVPEIEVEPFREIYRYFPRFIESES